MGQERKVVTLSWTNWAALALKMRLKIWEVKHDFSYHNFRNDITDKIQ